MNRREFIKSGMAALATLWCVKVTEKSVVAEIKTEYDCGEIEKETERLEYDCGNRPNVVYSSYFSSDWK